MRATTIYGRGGRRRISRFDLSDRLLATIRAVQNFAWKVGAAARRSLLGPARQRPVAGDTAARPITGDAQE